MTYKDENTNRFVFQVYVAAYNVWNLEKYENIQLIFVLNMIFNVWLRIRGNNFFIVASLGNAEVTLGFPALSKT